MKTEAFYKTKVKPFMPDDTVEYKDLPWYEKVRLWFMARSCNKNCDK